MEWTAKSSYLENLATAVKLYEENIRQHFQTRSFPEGLANDLIDVKTILDKTYPTIPSQYVPFKNNVLGMQTGLIELEKIVREKRLDDLQTARNFLEGKMNMVAISIDALLKKEKQSKSL